MDIIIYVFLKVLGNPVCDMSLRREKSDESANIAIDLFRRRIPTHSYWKLHSNTLITI